MAGEGKTAIHPPDRLDWTAILRWIGEAVRRSYAGSHLRWPEGDEAVSIACERILRKVCGFDPGGAATFESWVRMHAGFAIQDVHRQRVRIRDRSRGWTDDEDSVLESLPAPDGAVPVDPLMVEEFREAFERCLAKLTETQRERFLAAEVDSSPRPKLKAVAAALGIALDRLKETLKVARTALRSCLDRFDLRPPGSADSSGKDAGGPR